MERGQATRPRRSPRSTAGRRVATGRRPAYGRPRGRRRDGGIRECRAGLTDGAWPRWRRRCWRSRARRARGRASTRWPRSIPSGRERRRPRRSRPATSTATASPTSSPRESRPPAATSSILPGLGNGTFGAARVFPANARPESVAVADFDEDGFTDVVVPADTAPFGVTVLLDNANGSSASRRRRSPSRRPPSPSRRATSTATATATSPSATPAAPSA